MPTVDTLRLGEGMSGPLLEAAATPSGGEAKEVRVGQHPQRGHCTLAGGATTYVPCTAGGMAGSPPLKVRALAGSDREYDSRMAKQSGNNIVETDRGRPGAEVTEAAGSGSIKDPWVHEGLAHAHEGHTAHREPLLLPVKHLTHKPRAQRRTATAISQLAASRRGYIERNLCEEYHSKYITSNSHGGGNHSPSFPLFCPFHLKIESFLLSR